MSAINQLQQECVRFLRRTYTPFRCRARVVAKSAHLRFRLAAKTALAPLLLLSPQSLRLCGDPRLGRCVLRTRWGAALPKPLAHPQERNTRFASVPFLRVRYRQCQIGAVDKVRKGDSTKEMDFGQRREKDALKASTSGLYHPF